MFNIVEINIATFFLFSIISFEHVLYIIYFSAGVVFVFFFSVFM